MAPRAEVRFSEERNPRISEKEVCEVTLFGHGHIVRAKAAERLPVVGQSDQSASRRHRGQPAPGIRIDHAINTISPSVELLQARQEPGKQ